MKNGKKRIMALLLVMLLISGLFPTNAFAGIDDYCVECNSTIKKALENGTHCDECLACYSEVEKCADFGNHCTECCENNGWLCKNCGVCAEGYGTDLCPGCNYCTDCGGWCDEHDKCLQCCVEDRKHCPECLNSYTHAYCVECGKCNFCTELCDVCEELCEECCVCEGITIKGTISNHNTNKDVFVRLIPESDMSVQLCTVKAGTDSYSFKRVPEGKYTLMVIQEDIKIAERTVTVGDKNITLDFSCSRPPCPSCGKEPVGVVCADCGDCSECAVICPSHGLCTSCSMHLGAHCTACAKCSNEYKLCPECGICDECIELCETCNLCGECAMLKGKHCPECHECYTHAYCVKCGKCNYCVELCEVCEELCEECCECVKVTIKGTISGHDASKNVIVKLVSKAGIPVWFVTVKAGTDSYSFANIPSGEYTVTVIQEDISIAERTITVGDKNITLDFDCTPRPACPSCDKVPEGEVCAECGKCDECIELCEICGLCDECADSKGKHCPECHKCYTHAYCVNCGKCNYCVELCEVCEELCYECCVCNGGVTVKGTLKGYDPAKKHMIFMYPDDPEKDTRQYELLEGRFVFQFVGVPACGYTIEVHQDGVKIAEKHIEVGIKDIEVEIIIEGNEEEGGLIGDVNGDGYINALDATQILRYANNKASSLSGCEEGTATFKAADVNVDGKINALDATQILRFANNKPSALSK